MKKRKYTRRKKLNSPDKKVRGGGKQFNFLIGFRKIDNGYLMQVGKVEIFGATWKDCMKELAKVKQPF